MDKTFILNTIIFPQEKNGYDKGELLKGEQSYSIAAFGVPDTGNYLCKAQQVILVSDDTPKKNDVVYCDGSDIDLGNDIFKWDGSECLLPMKKVIASHPHISGTLRISEKTMQIIADNNGECVFEPSVIEGLHGGIDYNTFNGNIFVTVAGCKKDKTFMDAMVSELLPELRGDNSSADLDKSYDAGYNAGVSWQKQQFKPSLLDAINHLDALDSLRHGSSKERDSGRTTYIEAFAKEENEVIEKLKVSLDKLRKQL